MEYKNIMIAGLGALGMIYADALERVPGVKIYGIVDEARRERYAKDGRMFNGVRKDYEYITAGSSVAKADLVIVTTKSSGLSAALDEMAGVIKDDTVIISFMNGISSERIIGERFGMEHVVGAVFLGHPGQNTNGSVTHDGIFKSFIGELEGASRSERVDALEKLFAGAGLDISVHENIKYKLWSKFMMLVAFNQPTVLYNSDWTPYTRIPGGMDLSAHLMDEVAEIARKLGIAGTDRMIAENLEFVRESPAATVPSIYQDFIEKRPMEVDILSGEVARLGEELGVPVPYNRAVMDILNVHNGKLKL
jgi:2-dehydropantoate 2-reductase